MVTEGRSASLPHCNPVQRRCFFLFSQKTNVWKKHVEQTIRYKSQLEDYTNRKEIDSINVASDELLLLESFKLIPMYFVKTNLTILTFFLNNCVILLVLTTNLAKQPKTMHRIITNFKSYYHDRTDSSLHNALNS